MSMDHMAFGEGGALKAQSPHQGSRRPRPDHNRSLLLGGSSNRGPEATHVPHGPHHVPMALIGKGGAWAGFSLTGALGPYVASGPGK